MTNAVFETSETFLDYFSWNKNAVSVVRVLDAAEAKIKEQSLRCLGGVVVL